MKKRPNFFILGAPKCGTTSLASWLADHPDIFISDPKEPNFFCKDIDVINAPPSLEEYEHIFSSVRPEHIVIGEASTAYLRSVEAVPAILRYNPEAKFLVSIRNPIDMVVSAHKQLYRGGVETEPDLQKAWSLQADRASGKNLPRRDLNPERYQYGNICALGSQLERLLAIVPKERVLITLLDDMQANPNLVYKDVLGFLGLASDSRTQFPVHNERRDVKSFFVTSLAYSIANAKRRMGWTRGTGMGRHIQQWNTRTDKQRQITLDMRATLEEYFKEEIEKLEKLLRRDLSHWLS
jgi:hypothetical protein